MTCEYVSHAETAQQAKDKLMEHAGIAHAQELAHMTDEQKAEMAKKADELLAA